MIVVYDKSEISQKIKQFAHDLEFDKTGIAVAEPLDPAPLEEWLRRNEHGKMAYMQNNVEKRLDPRKLVEGAKSVISLAKNYYTPHKHSTEFSVGRISRYAWGDDYHDVLRPRLKEVLAHIQKLVPGCNGRVFVDTAPIMDKQWAVKAGIGWQGKNSNIITREFGSWIFLGEIVVDIELDYDTPIKDFCGTCTRCIDACPTGAIVELYIVDANRCISYLTIELKPDNEIPTELKTKMGNIIFGCDICQDVCPWNNKFAQKTDEAAFHPRPFNLNPPLKTLSKLDINEFQVKFRKSPIKRAKFLGFMRNIRAALENYQREKKNRKLVK
ncbi:MAG: tRNA epoxyqueuosine(34) reductase QueG [Calditrichaeota bacterium]|nr:tRNA epoxyqueuosine(34) reductase QueG [Calditrichota bacterium]